MGSLADGQQIKKPPSFRWLVLSSVLLIIGLGFTLYLTLVDVNNLIHLTYEIGGDVVSQSFLARPILSNNQVHLDPRWTTIRTLTSAIGLLALVIASPQLIIIYFVFVLTSLSENIWNGIQYIIAK